MNAFDSLTAMIQKLIADSTRFNVPRIGIVSQNEDPLKKGRILVHIPAFSWVTDDTGAWCYAKDKHALIVPDIDDYVLVEFIDGDMDLPVYSGIAQQMKDMLPAVYDGSKQQILFDSKADNFSVRYNQESKEYIIGTGDESFVKGDTAKPELQKNVNALTQLKTDLTAWTPAPNDGGAALKVILLAGFLNNTFADLTSILSDKIKGE